MVASKQENVFRILNFQGHQQGDDLNAKKSSINVVSKKQKLSLIWESVLLENVKQIEKLTVDVAHDDQRRADSKDIGFILYFLNKIDTESVLADFNKGDEFVSFDSTFFLQLFNEVFDFDVFCNKKSKIPKYLAAIFFFMDLCS